MSRSRQALRNILAALVLLAALSHVAPLRAEPLITEFLAANTKTHADDDGAFSDWIELHNPDAAALDLTGWYLTDTATNKTRWQFPAVTLPPGGYLIVFASNKNRRDPARPLHTNFALANEGEYLALVKPDGTSVTSEYAPAYPRQTDDVSFGLNLATTPPTPVFFDAPTPGAANGASRPAPIAATAQFSRASGPFAEPFLLELSGAGPGQHIRYVAVAASLAGAIAPEPTSTSPRYTGPISISSPVLIRAAVFSDDLAASGASRLAHYFRIDLTGTNGLAAFSTHLPVFVIEQHGIDELHKEDGVRPAWLYGFAPRPAGTPTFGAAPAIALPVNTAVRGASSAIFPKKSYNVDLLNDAGKEVPHALFGPLAFDEWALIGPWQYDPSLIRNSIVYELSNRIGRWAPRTQPVEVFLNARGTPLDRAAYVGVYLLSDKVRIEKGRVDLAELPKSATTEPAITGGYLMKIDVPDPDEHAFNTTRKVHEDSDSSVVVVSPKADNLSAPQRAYIQGYVQQMEDALYADQASGWATRTYLNYLDRASWVDHHLLNALAANPDALERSAYFTKDRGGKIVAGPVWDFDRALGSYNDERSWLPDLWFGGGAVDIWHFGWWGVLARDPEFMQDWVDRWQSLRRTEFTDENLTQVVERLGAAVGPEPAARDHALWTESVSHRGSHAGEIDHLKTWLLERASWIDEQFVAAPSVSVAGATLTLTPSAGAQLAYTLDGSDPRARGGAVAPNAVLASGPATVPATSNVQARSYRPAAADTFPGSAWSSAVGGPASSPIAPKSRLVNISSRATVGAGEDALIAGVFVADTAGKRYLARAVGPGLAAFGASGTVPDPQLTIVASNGAELARNLGWQTGPDAASMPALARSVGAFPLEAGSGDSALVTQLGTGAFTMQVSTPTGRSGIGLAELYEVDGNGRTVNLSTRARVGSGERVLIGGFVVQGVAHKRMLIRAVGPTLSSFGVGDALLDPVLTVFSNATPIASNDRWTVGQDAAVIANASTRVGAFALGTNTEDAALLISLPPGPYTVEVRSKDDDEGVALLEIYEVP